MMRIIQVTISALMLLLLPSCRSLKSEKNDPIDPIFYEAFRGLETYTAMEEFRILKYFKSGKDDEALELLERRLDGAVVTYDGWIGQDDVTKGDKEVFLNHLGHISDYRKQHPRKVSPKPYPSNDKQHEIALEFADKAKAILKKRIENNKHQ